MNPLNPSQSLRSHQLDEHYFGEGITYFQDSEGNNKILQLTWKKKIAFVYDANTMKKINEFTFETTTGEGWGVTFDKENMEFIVSDGGTNLHFWDRDTFKEKRKLEIKIRKVGQNNNSKEHKVLWLNELEFTHLKFKHKSGKTLDLPIILANVYGEDALICIDPYTGLVRRVYDFTNLYPTHESRGEEVFNGVSISDEEGIFYVTGKLWPYLYKIKLL